MGITKPCTLLHLSPSTSTQLISTSTQLETTSTQLISASTQLSATPLMLLEPKYRTWLGNFPKFRLKKNQSCPFWLKIGTHGILEVLIPNLDLDFWNSDPQIHFRGIGAKKVKVVHLTIGTHGNLRMLIFIPTLAFWISNPKSIFGQIWTEKVKAVLPEN